MSDPSSLRQYAQAYRRLADSHANPDLRALLIRMADVWDALAAHTGRIAAKRAAAESMSDVTLAPLDDTPWSRRDAPELIPSDGGLVRKYENA